MELRDQLGPQSQQIHLSIQFKNSTLEVYSHPHSARKIIAIGNHRMGHHHIRINSTSPRMLEAIVVEIWK
jgi:hypothetical protein